MNNYLTNKELKGVVTGNSYIFLINDFNLNIYQYLLLNGTLIFLHYLYKKL